MAREIKVEYEPIAVRVEDLNEFGCPNCGHRSGSRLAGGGGGAIWKCGECGRARAVLLEGVDESPHEFTLAGGGKFRPAFQPHPRRDLRSVR